VDDLIPVLEEGFARHGIKTQIFHDTRPANCTFMLTYAATRNWDLASYLSGAVLTIWKNNRIIAGANYHLKGGGVLSLTKFGSTKEKLDPVIDQLLADVSTEPDEGSASANASEPAAEPIHFTNMTSSAQQLATQMGCDNVHPIGGTSFQAQCSNHVTIMLDCPGGVCHVTHRTQH
jgi:hypothetical protein